MSVILKKDAWKIKDPITGEYRDSGIFSTGLPEEAERVVADAREDINEIAAAVASMAQLGTDTTLTTPGMAADAKTVGDKFSDLKKIVCDELVLNSGAIIPFENCVIITNKLTIGNNRCRFGNNVKLIASKMEISQYNGIIVDGDNCDISVGYVYRTEDTPQGIAFSLNGNNNIVHDTVLSGMFWQSVYIHGNGNKVVNCIFDDDGVVEDGEGSFYRTTPVKISNIDQIANILIEGNTFYSFTDNAIDSYYGAKNVIISNNIFCIMDERIGTNYSYIEFKTNGEDVSDEYIISNNYFYKLKPLVINGPMRVHFINNLCDNTATISTLNCSYFEVKGNTFNNMTNNLFNFTSGLYVIKNNTLYGADVSFGLVSGDTIFSNNISESTSAVFCNFNNCDSLTISNNIGKDKQFNILNTSYSEIISNKISRITYSTNCNTAIIIENIFMDNDYIVPDSLVNVLLENTVKVESSRLNNITNLINRNVVVSFLE